MISGIFKVVPKIGSCYAHDMLKRINDMLASSNMNTSMYARFVSKSIFAYKDANGHADTRNPVRANIENCVIMVLGYNEHYAYVLLHEEAIWIDRNDFEICFSEIKQ